MFMHQAKLSSAKLPLRRTLTGKNLCTCPALRFSRSITTARSLLPSSSFWTQALDRSVNVGTIRCLSATRKASSGASSFKSQQAVDWHEVLIPINGRVKAVSSLWLRDSCTCEACVDPSSKQKNFLTSDIPVDIQAEVIEADENHVTISWSNDIPAFQHGHTTTILLSELAETYGSISRASTTNGLKKPWVKADLLSDGVDLQYADYMNDDRVLYKALQLLRRYGLIFITAVPDSTASVEALAERIGPIKNTLYGRTWDVRSVPEARNVAYTSRDLGFHMDLLPLDTVPALQLLHCIRSSAKGGKSLFMDSLKAVQDLYESDAAAVKTLRTFPVTYHYDHPETHIYSKQRPVIESASSNPFSLQEDDETQVNWSPPFQGPFRPRDSHAASTTFAQNLATWHQAARKFNELIHRPDGIYGRQMAPGECVIFANRRVLHARTAFEVDDAGKKRWLRGTYIDEAPWSSKYEVLRRRFDAAA